MLTPASHAVRLVKLTYADSANGKGRAARALRIHRRGAAGELASRLSAQDLKIKGAGPSDLEPDQSALVAMFQYMIGNTDFSVRRPAQRRSSSAWPTGDYLPVAYDFDFSGAVNARYAAVDPRCRIKRVRDRLYRGYCVPRRRAIPKSFALFNAKKDSIYALYHDPIGKLLQPDVVDETLKYFDEFYKTINNPKSAKSDIIDRMRRQEDDAVAAPTPLPVHRNE